MTFIHWILIVVVLFILQDWFEGMAYNKPKSTTKYMITSGAIAGLIANLLITLLGK